MDIALIRTFLEVAATGSFVAASDRLFVTQSAVSLRVARLEAELGGPLFTRSKAGASLTSAGEAFHPYALSLTRVWQEARQQVAVPKGYVTNIALGAEGALWPRLGFRWIDALREARPDISLKAEMGLPDHLTRLLLEGVIQAALTYVPTMRPGLIVEELLEDELVLVSAIPRQLEEVAGHYVLIDWGPEFIQTHAQRLPELTGRGLTLTLGVMATGFLLRRGKAAYLPARHVGALVERGDFHLVPDAPSFPFPAWVVWREDLDSNLRDVAGRTLSQVAKTADQAQDRIIEKLNGMKPLPDQGDTL